MNGTKKFQATSMASNRLEPVKPQLQQWPASAPKARGATIGAAQEPEAAQLAAPPEESDPCIQL